jgi:hypothetical protein
MFKYKRAGTAGAVYLPSNPTIILGLQTPAKEANRNGRYRNAMYAVHIDRGGHRIVRFGFRFGDARGNPRTETTRRERRGEAVRDDNGRDSKEMS